MTTVPESSAPKNVFNLVTSFTDSTANSVNAIGASTVADIAVVRFVCAVSLSAVIFPRVSAIPPFKVIVVETVFAFREATSATL